MDNQSNESKELEELRNENFQTKSNVESLSILTWYCFEQLGVKPDRVKGI